MTDQNECRFSGVVETFQVIQTKTGTPMIKAMIQCGREKISVIAFKELADRTRLNQGDRISLAGSVQSTSWEKDGVKRYGWQVIASEITIEIETTTPAPEPRRSAAPIFQQDLPF